MLCSFVGQVIWPQSRAPSIKDISLENIGWRKDHILAPSTQANLKIDYQRYNNKKVIANYVLYPEAFSNKIGGDIQKSPEPIEFDIVSQSDNELTFVTPGQKGAYRIICICKKRKRTKLSSKYSFSYSISRKTTF